MIIINKNIKRPLDTKKNSTNKSNYGNLDGNRGSNIPNKFKTPVQVLSHNSSAILFLCDYRNLIKILTIY